MPPDLDITYIEKENFELRNSSFRAFVLDCVEQKTKPQKSLAACDFPFRIHFQENYLFKPTNISGGVFQKGSTDQWIDEFDLR